MPAHPVRRTALSAIAVSHRWADAALLALALFVLSAVVLHLRRPELDPVHSQMSLYLIGLWGPLLQAAYAALSVGMVALAFGLRAAASPHGRSLAPLLLFALGGVALTTTAYAWMDLPGADRTFEGLVHGVSAQAAFLCATGGMVVQALCFRRDPAWRAIARWALPWALLCFASIWVLAGWRDAPRGLAQKTVIALIVGWLACVALVLWQRTRAAATRIR